MRTMMSEVNDHFEEEYLYLGDVTHKPCSLRGEKFSFTSKWVCSGRKSGTFTESHRPPGLSP
jgi:hypothetical protein